MTTSLDRLPPPSTEEPAASGQPAALLRLVLVVAAVIVVGFLAGVGETVLLVGALLLCIVLHELGHFLTAKAAKMKVTEFFVGFGPRLWSVRRGETDYGVKTLPLGGYCRIIGMNNLEEVDPLDEARTYREKSVPRRLSVALAGSAMHFLIAIVVLFSMFFWTGDQANYLPLPTIPGNAKIVGIDGLTTGASPAQEAGFKLGDRIVAVDGHRFATWDEVTGYIKAHPGQRLDVTVERAGAKVDLYPTPVDLSKVTPSGVGTTGLPKVTTPTGFLGIEINPSVIVHSGLGPSISDAGGAWVHISALTLHALGRLVTFHGISDYAHMLTSQKAADSVTQSSVRFASPVKVVQLFHQAGQNGLPTVLWLLAIINLSLGIFNLIPLLPLDGGHVAIAVYEGVRSRIRGRRYQADVGKLVPLFYLALAAIVFLGATSLFLDIRDLVS